MKIEEMWEILNKYIYDNDHPNYIKRYGPNYMDGFRRQFYEKFNIAALYNPKSLLEIGVRGGYSAFAMVSACPDCSYLGIDNNSNLHGGTVGYYEKALAMMKKYFPYNDIKVEIHDSQKLESLPPCDMLHVDGDHSYKGCMHDISIGLPTSKVIVVDDYDYVSEVRNACDDFKKQHPDLNCYEWSDGGFRGNFIIETKNCQLPRGQAPWLE